MVRSPLSLAVHPLHGLLRAAVLLLPLHLAENPSRQQMRRSHQQERKGHPDGIAACLLGIRRLDLASAAKDALLLQELVRGHTEADPKDHISEAFEKVCDDETPRLLAAAHQQGARAHNHAGNRIDTSEAQNTRGYFGDG